jgi:type II secretory pathway pseudopilin PulG
MLIELMVSIIVAGMLAVSLCQSLSQTKQASFGAHGRVMCAAVAQEITERLHATPYGELPTPNPGTSISIPIYSDDAQVTPTYSFQVRPLMTDVTPSNYLWSSATLANRFPMTAQVTFTAGPFPSCEWATVTVSSVVAPHDYVVSTLLTQHGTQEE